MSAEAASSAEDECLLAMQTSGISTPLFVIHGVQCHPIFGHVLAKRLGKEQPVYAFQAPGLDGRATPLRSIESMAQCYLDSARRIQPLGPYLLVGFCAGGHVAMEMAHQLRAAGESVAHLFLVDTPPSLDPRAIDQLETAVRISEQRLERYPQARRRLGGAPNTIAAFCEALQAYRKRPYFGRVHILASNERLPAIRDPERGWSKCVPSSTPVWVVAPTHESIIRHKIGDVAICIRERLNEDSLTDFERLHSS